MPQNVVCLKIGGSVITDKSIPYKVNKAVIRSIAKSLKDSETPILIGHGSGSFAHTSAKIYGGKHGYEDRWGIAKVFRDAQAINSIVMDIFIEEGLPVISFSPRSFMIARDGLFDASFFQPIDQALQQGLIPVVYGDVILDEKQKTTIFSGETTLNLLCRHLQRTNIPVSKIIQLCNVDGVINDRNEVIPEITKDIWHEVKEYIHTMNVTDVTGGMEHKIEDALAMTKYGIETWLMNGNRPHNIVKAIHGKPKEGTVIR